MLTDLPTDSFVPKPRGIPAIRGQAIAERPDWTTFVVVATQGPVKFVPIRVMCAEVNDATRAQMVVDNVQSESATKPGIAGDRIDMERGIELGELQ